MKPNRFYIDNNGIGGTPYLTFRISTKKGQSFTQEDLNGNLTACVITGNNEIGKVNINQKQFG